MSIQLTLKQKEFVDAKSRVCCQWFERREGATSAIVVDSVIKSFEKGGSSFVFVDNHRLLPYTRDLYNHFYKSYDFIIKVNDYKMYVEVLNLNNDNTIKVFTKNFLESYQFRNYEGSSYIYVDDYTFNYNKASLHWLLRKADRQVKIVGKYE